MPPRPFTSSRLVSLDVSLSSLCSRPFTHREEARRCARYVYIKVNNITFLAVRVRIFAAFAPQWALPTVGWPCEAVAEVGAGDIRSLHPMQHAEAATAARAARNGHRAADSMRTHGSGLSSRAASAHAIGPAEPVTQRVHAGALKRQFLS